MHPLISFEHFVPFLYLVVLMLPNFKAESNNVPFAGGV